MLAFYNHQRRYTLVLASLIALVLLGTSCASTLLSVSTWRERSKADLVQRDIQVGTHRIVYLEGGEGATVLFVHGFAANKDNWTRLAQQLPGFHLVALDLPGAGESTKNPEASYDILSQTKRLKAFVTALHLSSFHLVGNSMGGHIATNYAATYPQDVRSLALLDAAGVKSPKPSEMSKALAQGKNPLLVQNEADFDRLLNFIFVHPPQMPASIKRDFAAQAVRNYAFNQKIFADLGKAPLPLDAPGDDILSKVKAPTLVLWGQQDRVIDVSAAQVFAAGIPNATVKLFPQAGHAPMIEAPEQVANALTTFWGRLAH